MMDVRVRVGNGKDFREREDEVVQILFDDIKDAMDFVEMVVDQGYVAKVGIGSLDE